MKNNETFKEYVAPILVLVCICLVVTAALAATFGIADPIIQENTKKAADEARIELLADADSFTAFDGELAVCEAAKETCGFFVNDVQRVTSNLGWEQEYFLVDEALFSARQERLFDRSPLQNPFRASKDAPLPLPCFL